MRLFSNSKLLVIWSCLLHVFTYAFYIPGYSIKSYAEGENVPLFVNKVYSDNSQLQYAYAELPFVCPAQGRQHTASSLITGSSVSLNLGEILRGDRITVSDYELSMLRDVDLKVLCTKKVNRRDLLKALEIVRGGYVAEWIVDNLPGATQFVSVDRSRKYYAAGFKVGYEERALEPEDENQYFLNNHVTIVIRYRSAPGADGQRGKKVIVAFEVYPRSLGLNFRDTTGLPLDAHSEDALNIAGLVGLSEVESSDGQVTIPYTYSVHFREDNQIEWSSRWDPYFVNQEESSSIHWLAIVNSLVISGLLAAVVAVILARTISGDIKGKADFPLEEGKTKLRRKRPARSPTRILDKGVLEPIDGAGAGDTLSDEEGPEDISGWKLVHADVFRSPSNGRIFAPLIGSGMQLIFMATGLILLSCFGVLNPSFRGGFVSVGIGLFIFAGLLSGYFSARIYKTFGGEVWRQNAIITASLFPGLLFATVFILNLFVWAQASSTAIPLGSLIALVILWLLVQVPLVYAGSWYGYIRSGAFEHPIKVAPIPRQIPPQAWWMRSLSNILLSGLVPFLVVFIELMFVFKSVWQDKTGYYYLFGFLGAVALILVISVMEITIVATYIQLCNENYHWWWQSFFVGASSAIWIFSYCVWYYFARLHIQGFVSSLLFFSYSFLACVVYGLLTGTIGFLTAYTFVQRIYGAIKVD